MMHSVQEFITTTSLNYFSHTNAELKIGDVDNHLKDFIEEPQCLILFAYLHQNLIEFQKEIPSEYNGVKLVFFKRQPIALETSGTLEYLNITIIQNNPIESIYLSLKHVYEPMLQSDNSTHLDPKLQETISQLVSTLQIMVHGKDGNSGLMVVLSVEDELNYWQTIIKESKAHKQKEMAKSFVSILQLIFQELESLNVSDAIEIADIMDNVGGLLDDLWRHSQFLYPQKRMAHLLDIIGNMCVMRLQEILNEMNVWSSDSNIISKINECSDAAMGWLKICANHTQKYWPNHSLHAWQGPPHPNKYVTMFHQKVSDVIEIRSIHQQLTKLLSPMEQKELDTKNMFHTFSGINIWKYSSQKNTAWLKAKAYFEKMLKPAENKIAEKLKTLLINLSPSQMIYEFGKYSALIERPVIFNALLKERQILMGTIGQVLREIENQIGLEKDQYDPIVHEVSPLVQQIQWTKRMDKRVEQIEHVITKLLSDLDGSKDLLYTANSVRSSIINMQITIFEDWTRSLQAEMNNKNIILSPDTPVVEFFGENNFMRVTFNPQIITHERDIRHMIALGFTIPANIKDAVNNAAQFMEQARALQHVASFHNNLGERMIPSQRPMMLNAAVQLASLVKEQTAVPWKNVDSVAKYVEKLMNAVENLSKQNAFLTSQHVMLRNITLSLMDMNLLQKQSDWKKCVRQMRDIIEKVEANGYINTKPWMNHWNIQLYKALEHQYRSILIDPISHLPVLRTELIFRQQSVLLQPTIEELRLTCHSHLKKLITLPAQFIGLQSQYGNEESIFGSIISRNSWLVSGAMLEIENTLKKVIEATQRWKIWGALGSVDLDSLCEIHLSQPTDWDKNFKECKAFGQAIAKLPMDDEQIDWVLISSASLRSDLESHNRRYWLSLTTSLQGSAQQDSLTLESYMLSAQNAMEKSTPKTAKELASLNAEFIKLKEKEEQMSLLFENLKQKQRMVKTWSGERAMTMDHLTKKWDQLLITMQNHEKLVAYQTETIKATILNDWQNLMGSIDTWFSKWKVTKPKIDQLTNISYLELRNKYKLFTDSDDSFQNYYTNIEEILNECEKFSIQIEDQFLWKSIEKNMKEDTIFWEPLKSFSEGLNELGDQEWIIFQKKMHLLDDFILDWKNKTEPITPITLIIQKEINKYKDMMPSLKYLRCTDLTEKHWREIYSLLEMPTKTSNDLVLNDFLCVAENIKINSKELQRISLDASQEAIVREAVAELELWLAGARLTMIKHNDHKGLSISIIKDFKETLAKVEEYQNLAGSARSTSNLKDGNSNDQLSIWENRLGHMRVVLSSLAHIQRK